MSTVQCLATIVNIYMYFFPYAQALKCFNNLRCNSQTIQITHLMYNSMFFFTVTEVCIHVYNQFQNIFITTKRNPNHSHCPFPTPSSPWQLLIYCLSLQICLVWPFRKNGIIQYVVFSYSILSFNVMFIRFTCFGEYINTFLFVTK